MTGREKAEVAVIAAALNWQEARDAVRKESNPHTLSLYYAAEDRLNAQISDYRNTWEAVKKGDGRRVPEKPGIGDRYPDQPPDDVWPYG